LNQSSADAQTARRFEEPVFEIPIKPDFGLLGRRWTARILSDIGFRKVNRFSQLIRANPGLTGRLLSKRLRELEAEGFIRRSALRERSKVSLWLLSRKGKELLPVLMEMIVFGSKWNNTYRFQGKPPSLVQQGLSDARRDTELTG